MKSFGKLYILLIAAVAFPCLAPWACAQTFTMQNGTNGYSGCKMRQIRADTDKGSSSATSAVGMSGSGAAQLRSVQAFNLSPVPPELIVTNVMLEINVYNTDSSFNKAVQMHAITNIHPIIESGGSGDVSTDMTWSNVTNNFPWHNPGGDYAPAVLASVNPSTGGNMNGVYNTNEWFIFSSPAMVATVQAALANGQPFQYILISAEQEAANGRAFVRWCSNNFNLEVERRAKLTVSGRFRPPGSVISFR